MLNFAGREMVEKVDINAKEEDMGFEMMLIEIIDPLRGTNEKGSPGYVNQFLSANFSHQGAPGRKHVMRVTDRDRCCEGNYCTNRVSALFQKGY